MRVWERGIPADRDADAPIMISVPNSHGAPGDEGQANGFLPTSTQGYWLFTNDTRWLTPVAQIADLADPKW